MVYFGWPNAHEDDAERGVRSALEIVQAVKGVSAANPLAVHIGIATGTVVVGEASAAMPPATRDWRSAKRRTSRHGFRARAASDEVVIAAEHAAAGRRCLRARRARRAAAQGIASRYRAWRVHAVRSTAGRFDAAHGGAALTPWSSAKEELGAAAARLGRGARPVWASRVGQRRTRHRQVAADPGAARAHQQRAAHDAALPVLAVPPQRGAVSR